MNIPSARRATWVLLLVGSVLVAWRVWRETSSY